MRWAVHFQQLGAVLHEGAAIASTLNIHVFAMGQEKFASLENGISISAGMVIWRIDNSKYYLSAYYDSLLAKICKQSFK